MVKDTFNSFFDNIKERTTNPFLGTLIVVWLIHNWSLVYSLLYFDSALTLEKRLAYIKLHFAKITFTSNLFDVVLITLAVLVATYALLSFSRLLTEFYDNVIVPFIIKLVSKGSKIVPKTDYKKLQEIIVQMESDLEKERLAKISAQKERDEAYAKILPYQPDLKSEDIPKLNENNLDNRAVEPYERISKELKTKFTEEFINQRLVDIMNDKSLNVESKFIRQLLREGVVIPSSGELGGKRTYRLSDYGEVFIRYWNNKGQYLLVESAHDLNDDNL